jgi:hypothetical protein
MLDASAGRSATATSGATHESGGNGIGGSGSGAGASSGVAGGATGGIGSGTAGLGGNGVGGGAGGGSGRSGGGDSVGGRTSNAGADATGGRNDAGRASGGAGMGTMAGGGASGGAPSMPSAGAGGAVSSDRAQEVCRRWSDDRMDMSEGTWSGSVASCDAGDLSAPGRDNALKLVNLYRFLADMPEVAMDDSYNQAAQACALLQSANTLSHDQPTTANCYTQLGADASQHSSISSGKGVHSIDGYMTDGAGNADTMGHRRWIFANYIGPVGFGSATSSCFYQPAGKNNAKKAFVAWPPAGPVPLAAITTTKADTAGWTIQSDSVDLSMATVTVKDGDQDQPVTQSTLPGGYGSQYALRIVPTGWTLTAGHSYAVTASGTTVSYTIDVVDCGS